MMNGNPAQAGFLFVAFPYVPFMKPVCAIAIVLFLSSCSTSVTRDEPNGHPVTTPLDSAANANLLPVGFDIRVFAGAQDFREIDLTVELDIPKGSYVISAHSNRDYLGKFQIAWVDSAVQAVSPLVEAPPSSPGWEPFDRIYTPMMFGPTTLTQGYRFPEEQDIQAGQVFFVLEPQCIAYALDFTIEKEPSGWSATYGEVHPVQPG